MNKETLILGFGSPLLSDEAIVPMILRKLRGQFGKGVRLREELTINLDLLNYLEGYATIVIIDTIEKPTEEPGEVRTFGINNYEPTLHLDNLHDVSLPELLTIGKRLAYEITDDIYIISINIEDHETISNKLTKELKGRFDAVFHTVSEVLEKLVIGQNIVNA